MRKELGSQRWPRCDSWCTLAPTKNNIHETSTLGRGAACIRRRLDKCMHARTLRTFYGEARSPAAFSRLLHAAVLRFVQRCQEKHYEADHWGCRSRYSIYLRAEREKFLRLAILGAKTAAWTFGGSEIQIPWLLCSLAAFFMPILLR